MSKMDSQHDKKPISSLGTVASYVTILGAAIGAVWYFFNLDSRISILEKQIQAINIVNIKQSNPGTESDSMNLAEIDNDNPEVTIEYNNILVTLCEDAIKEYQNIESGNNLKSINIRAIISNLGCYDVIRSMN